MSESLTTPTLPTFSWIGHLKTDDRDLLSSYGDFFPGHPGNVIIEQGVTQTEVFVVISGELEVYSVQEDGTRILRARVGPGETLGEICLFDPGAATATVIATEFSQLWRIADADLIRFMEENPGAGNLLLRTLATILAQRLRRVDPEAFGISAYAVVDSPELKEQEADAQPPLETAAAIPENTPVVPVAPAVAAPPVKPIVAEVMSQQVPVTRDAPLPPSSPIPQEPADPNPRRMKKTQPFRDPDKVEPL
jgi:hypothetical protein